MPNCISLGSINVKSMYYVAVQWHNNNILTLKTFARLIAAKVLTHLIACCSRCGKSLSPIYSSTKLTTTTVPLILLHSHQPLQSPSIPAFPLQRSLYCTFCMRFCGRGKSCLRE